MRVETGIRSEWDEREKGTLLYWSVPVENYTAVRHRQKRKAKYLQDLKVSSF